MISFIDQRVAQALHLRPVPAAFAPPPSAGITENPQTFCREVVAQRADDSLGIARGMHLSV